LERHQQWIDPGWWKCLGTGNRYWRVCARWDRWWWSIPQRAIDDRAATNSAASAESRGYRDASRPAAASTLEIAPPYQSILPTDQQSSLNPPIITVIGKAFFDIGHAPADQSNRRTDLKGYAAWEIHPVMKLGVLPEKQRAATWRKRDGSVAELRLLRLVDLFSHYSGRLRCRFAHFELDAQFL
jgi:hypothetical protein